MKILWSVNAFDTDKQPLRAMASLLRPLAGKDKPIEAIYVASHAENQLMLAFDVPEAERFSSYPFAKLQAATKLSGLTEDEVAEEVIYEPSTSTSKAADRIIEAAREKKAGLIATYTHGRKGLERFFLGSFAETLLYRSPLPVLLMRPGIKPIRALRTVLFATDATPASRKAFTRILSLLPAGTKIVVFHLGEPRRPLGASKHIEDHRQRMQATAELERYQKTGVEKGFNVKLVTEFEFHAPSDAIQEAAEKQKADLVAVAAQRNPTLGMMIGSTTRQLLRESATPLLVFKA